MPLRHSCLKFLRKDSRNTNALRLRASIRMARGQLASAITDLRQAFNDRPRSTDLMLLLASAYERSGSIGEADKLYSAAVKMSDFDPAVGLNYVRFLERRGRRDSAEHFGRVEEALAKEFGYLIGLCRSRIDARTIGPAQRKLPSQSAAQATHAV